MNEKLFECKNVEDIRKAFNTDKVVEKKENVKEAFSDSVMDEYQVNFEKFTKGLSKLSKQYGISIQSVGGVEVGEIKSISYDTDLSSGDLYPNVDWK